MKAIRFASDSIGGMVFGATMANWMDPQLTVFGACCGFVSGVCLALAGVD